MVAKVDFEAIKDKVLGKKYELSLVFVSRKKIQELNKKYRNIDAPTDILSFPLSKNEGEIFICKAETRKMAPEFDRPYENFLVYLFIHGLVHLAGHDHGSTMESIEKKYRQYFRI